MHSLWDRQAAYIYFHHDLQLGNYRFQNSLQQFPLLFLVEPASERPADWYMSGPYQDYYMNDNKTGETFEVWYLLKEVCYLSFLLM